MNSKLTLSIPITKQQILQTFEKYSYGPTTTITKQKMIEIMSNEYTQKHGNEVNQQLADQIWQQAQTISQGQISVNIIVEVVLKAQSILQNRIQQLRGNNGIIQQFNNDINDKQKQIRETQQYNSQDTGKINNLNQQLMNLEIQQRQNQHDLQTFASDYQTLNKIFGFGHNSHQQQQYQQISSQYFPPNLSQTPPQFTQPAIKQPTINPPSTRIVPPTRQPSRMVQKQSSNKLTMLFYLTCILIILQLFIISFLRVSMFTITLYLHSLYILLVGLNSKNSIVYLVIHFVVSILGDIAFVVLVFLNKDVFPVQISTTYSNYWLLFFAFLIITIVMKVIYIVVLVPFRNAYEAEYEDSFTVMGNTFFLHPIKSQGITHPYEQPSQAQYQNHNETTGLQRHQNNNHSQQHESRNYNEENI